MYLALPVALGCRLNQNTHGNHVFQSRVIVTLHFAISRLYIRCNLNLYTRNTVSLLGQGATYLPVHLASCLGTAPSAGSRRPRARADEVFSISFTTLPSKLFCQLPIRQAWYQSRLIYPLQIPTIVDPAIKHHLQEVASLKHWVRTLPGGLGVTGSCRFHCSLPYLSTFLCIRLVLEISISQKMAEKPLGEAQDAKLQLSETPETPVQLPDPDAPSTEVSAKKQSLSDIFTIVRFDRLARYINHANSP